MAKITRHVCDFNVNLREHDSHWFVTVNAKDDGPKDFDLCSGHLISALTPILNANGFKDLVVRRNSGVEDTPKVGEKAKESGGETRRYNCPECKLEVANLSGHLRQQHGQTLKEWKRDHGFDPEQRGYIPVGVVDPK